MTTAERLVRNLCEETRRRIEQDRQAALEKVPSEISVASLPKRVRTALSRYYQLQKESQRYASVLEAAGISTYEAGRRPVMKVTNKGRRDADAAIRLAAEVRLRAVSALRTNATVEMIGKSPAKAAASLQKLQRDLAAI